MTGNHINKIKKRNMEDFNLNLPIATRDSMYLGRHGVCSWSGACGIKFVLKINVIARRSRSKLIAHTIVAWYYLNNLKLISKKH